MKKQVLPLAILVAFLLAPSLALASSLAGTSWKATGVKKDGKVVPWPPGVSFNLSFTSKKMTIKMTMGKQTQTESVTYRVKGNTLHTVDKNGNKETATFKRKGKRLVIVNPEMEITLTQVGKVSRKKKNKVKKPSAPPKIPIPKI